MVNEFRGSGDFPSSINIAERIFKMTISNNFVIFNEDYANTAQFFCLVRFNASSLLWGNINILHT